ncbi:MAG: class I adenylate-forming enzyme family protein [Pirellulaceae bacterium]
MTKPFDWVSTSPIALPDEREYRFRSLAEMLFAASEQDSCRPVLIGAWRDEIRRITLRDLRSIARCCETWRIAQGLARGERVILLRLPYVSELEIAALTVGLMVAGISVVLPMHFDMNMLEDWLEKTRPKAILAPVESLLRESSRTRDLQSAIQRFCVDRQIENRPPCLSSDILASEPRTASDVDARLTSAEPLAEAIIFSTSASTGPPKLVRYSERALLATAESWHAAGLMSKEATGGASLCPLVAHSMGMRNVLHAIWNRQPTLLIPPEWIVERPQRVVDMLAMAPPQHFTGGPALIGALAQTTRRMPELSRRLRNLRTIVSSGATWSESIRGQFPRARFGNAFGMTETQQVLSTLIGSDGRFSEASPECGATGEPEPLGRPLPGVAIAVRFTDRQSRLGELFVKSPFLARGYVGSDEFGEWFATGDCVRVDVRPFGLREAQVTSDFVSLGSGIKVSLADVARRYARLDQYFVQPQFRYSPNREGLVAIGWTEVRETLVMLNGSNS